MTERSYTPEELDGVDPKVYQRRYGILGALCLSLVLTVATVSSVNVAIPFLAASELSPTDTQILWIVDAYALVFAALLLPAGALGDRFGRKGALLLGLVIFMISSLACAFMTSANALIVCRSIMGIGAAFIMPSTLSLLQSAFPRKERAKAIAVWAGFAGAGGAIGPLIGGVLMEHFWYGSVFLVSAPIGLIAFIASGVLAPKSREEQAARLDVFGAVLSAIGFAALLIAIIEGPERGWTDGLVILGFVLAVLGLCGFIFWERRVEHPLLDLHFFSKPRFAIGSLGISINFLAMFSMFFVLTQYLQYVLGYSPLAAGIRGMPAALTMVIMSPRGPKLVERFGAKRVVGGGFLVMAAGLLSMSFATRTSGYPMIAASLIVMALGVSVVMPNLSSGIVQSVPLHKAGVGSAVNDTTREVGGAIGIAVIGSVVNSIYRSKVSPALTNIPEAARELAKDNIAKALRVSDNIGQTVGAEAGSKLRMAVQNAFIDGMRFGLRISVVIVILYAFVVFKKLPDEEIHSLDDFLPVSNQTDR